MKQVQSVPRKRVLTSALLLALAGPAWAQQAEPQGNANPAPTTSSTADPTELDTIVVTGIRASLESSMNLKRDAQGVVDGIVAEDIGKFPDTNLAESLQRISGVSIDRTPSGEGSKVTVRGIGPDHNLVLLNGRQMPGALLNGFSASNSRAFDFANLASEAVSGIEVYKTGLASNPTGGIGATINIKTARPLESGPLMNLGMKTVHDTSNGNLPKTMQGSDWTGEMSGIFSQTFADGKFGIAVNGSYQERDSGFSQVGVTSGWRTHFGGEGGWGAIAPGTPGNDNLPGPTDLYFGAAEPQLQRQWHPAAAHQRSGDPAMGADGSHHHDAGLHVFRKQDPDAPQRNVGVVQFRWRGKCLDQWPRRRPGVLP